MRNKLALFLLFILILALSSQAVTLKGTIYNSNLNVEKDVLIQIDTTPAQKFLAKDGIYTFEIPPGSYTLTANKGFNEINEKVEIKTDGTFIYDLFLLPGFSEENDLLKDTEGDVVDLDDKPKYSWWRYALAVLIILVLLWRFWLKRKKYGPLRKFRRQAKTEQKKTLEDHKQDLANEPGYIDKALEIIKKHDGRISQKELRQELLPLSEAKISLIVTELEHKGKVEKIKKGRGNVIIVKY